jgi:hypothetical protein
MHRSPILVFSLTLIGAVVLAHPLIFFTGWKDWIFMEAGLIFGGGVMWLSTRR